MFPSLQKVLADGTGLDTQPGARELTPLSRMKKGAAPGPLKSLCTRAHWVLPVQGRVAPASSLLSCWLWAVCCNEGSREPGGRCSDPRVDPRWGVLPCSP